MNTRSMVAQTRKLSKIAKFAFGVPVHVSIDVDCDAYRGHKTPMVEYKVYIATPDQDDKAYYRTEEWKNVLSLIAWLEDIEAVTTFRSR